MNSIPWFLGYTLPMILLCAACNNFHDLGNGYRLQDSDLDHVYITRVDKGTAKIVVDQQVVDWQRSGDYILVLRKVAFSPHCGLANGRTNILTHNTSIDQYWILNAKSDEVIGPIDKSEFNVKKKKFSLDEVDLAAPGNYRDNTQEFQRMAAGCTDVGNR
jgi:hypothetical protein